MKTSKKVLSILMSAVIMLSLFSAVLSVTSFASGDWQYCFNEDLSEVYITGCSSNLSGDVVIPEEIDGRPVTIIDSQAFDNADGYITSIIISKNLMYFGDWEEEEAFVSSFSNLTGLEKIIVHKDNQRFSSDSNGVLYDKDKKFLILCPQECNVKSFTIPSTVIEIFEGAFLNNYSIETIIIPEELESFEDANPFDGMWSLKKIIVDENNRCYSNDKNGILFDKDKTEVISCPPNCQITEYTLPSSVKEVEECAFSSVENLRKIDMNNVVKIYDLAFWNCDNLTEIIFPKTLEHIESNIFGRDIFLSPQLTSIIYEGTKAQWAQVEGSQDDDRIVFLGKESNEEKNTTDESTDKKGDEIKNTEPVTDEGGNVSDNYNYDDDYDNDYSSGTTVSDKDKSDNKTLKIVLLIAAVVLILAAVVVLIIVKDKKGKVVYKTPVKTQTKTKEKTLSEDDIPGFVKFMNEDKPVQSHVDIDDGDFVPYNPEMDLYDTGSEKSSEKEDPTDGYFEWKPSEDAETNHEAEDDANPQLTEEDLNDKTQSFFDF